MPQSEEISSRKKFLVWGSAALASLTAFSLFAGVNKQLNKKTTTVKMLSQDGKLVEVDADKLFCGKRKKISDEQLKKWVKKDQNKTSG